MKLKFNINFLKAMQSDILISRYIFDIYFLKTLQGFSPHVEICEENDVQGLKNTAVFFNFDHYFYHDGIYFFSHNHICFAPKCMYSMCFESFAPLER